MLLSSKKTISELIYANDLFDIFELGLSFHDTDAFSSASVHFPEAAKRSHRWSN